jgi:hypothetical protein
VNVLCLMAGIVIICNSDSKIPVSAGALIAAKAKLLFDVFDFNQKGYITRDETSILLLLGSQIMRIITVQTTTTAAAAIDTAELDTMANELFTKGVLGNDEMKCEQFVSIAVQYMSHADDTVHSVMLDKLGLIRRATVAVPVRHEYATAHSEPQVSTESAKVTAESRVSVMITKNDDVDNTTTSTDNTIGNDTATCDTTHTSPDNDLHTQCATAVASGKHNNNSSLTSVNKGNTDTIAPRTLDASVPAVSDVMASPHKVPVFSHYSSDGSMLLTSPVSNHLAIDEPLYTGGNLANATHSSSLNDINSSNEAVNNNSGDSTVADTVSVPWWQTVAAQTTPTTAVIPITTASTAAAAAAPVYMSSATATSVLTGHHSVTPLTATPTAASTAVAATTTAAAANVSGGHNDDRTTAAKATVPKDNIDVSKANDTPVLQRADSELQQEASGIILLSDKAAYKVEQKPQLLLLTAAADTIITPATASAKSTSDDISKPTVSVSTASTADTAATAMTIDTVPISSGGSISSSSDDTMTQQQSAVQHGAVSDEKTDVTSLTTTTASTSAQSRLLQRADSELQQEATGIILLSDKAPYKQEEKPQLLLLTA